MKTVRHGAVLALLLCVALIYAAPAAMADGQETATADTGATSTTNTGADTSGSADTASTDTGSASTGSGSESGCTSSCEPPSCEATSSCTTPSCEETSTCTPPTCEQTSTCKPPETCEDRGDCPPKKPPVCKEANGCVLPKSQPPKKERAAGGASLPFTGPGDMLLPALLAFLALMAGVVMYTIATTHDVAVASTARARATLKRITGFTTVLNDVERDDERRNTPDGS